VLQRRIYIENWLECAFRDATNLKVLRFIVFVSDVFRETPCWRQRAEQRARLTNLS